MADNRHKPDPKKGGSAGNPNESALAAALRKTPLADLARAVNSGPRGKSHPQDSGGAKPPGKTHPQDTGGAKAPPPARPAAPQGRPGAVPKSHIGALQAPAPAPAPAPAADGPDARRAALHAAQAAAEQQRGKAPVRAGGLDPRTMKERLPAVRATSGDGQAGAQSAPRSAASRPAGNPGTVRVEAPRSSANNGAAPSEAPRSSATQGGAQRSSGTQGGARSETQRSSGTQGGARSEAQRSPGTQGGARPEPRRPAVTARGEGGGPPRAETRDPAPSQDASRAEARRPDGQGAASGRAAPRSDANRTGGPRRAPPDAARAGQGPAEDKRRVLERRPGEPPQTRPSLAQFDPAARDGVHRDAMQSDIEPDAPPLPEAAPRPPRRERPPQPELAADGAPFRNPLPPITFPEDLPVSGRREEIANALRDNQVVIVSGETGSGKTTQLPKICLELGRGRLGVIGHTQPRRIAASSTAKRIAQELGTPLGENVGFKVRFADQLTKGAAVKLMTDGILLAETQTDPLLKQYDTIIIDEAHERSLNIDFLLGYLKEILPRRPDLKVIITSATIDAERFARHFQAGAKPVPVIEVSGRLYKVEVRYRPIEQDKPAPGTQTKPERSNMAQAARDKRDLMDAIVDAVDELCRIGSGDVLVFLPGEREIRDAAEALRKHHPPHVEILPLFARLSAQEQERVFKPSGMRRIVLATNVAETSLTVPGIRYVVDAGLARVKRYSYRNKVEQLQIEPVAQSAANQRAGRCGRVQDGVCIRLYEEQDYLQRPKFTEPEILRSSLASVILRMKSLHLTDVESFPFIEPPQPRAIADGYQLLQELGAMDEANILTPLGRKLAKLPLDPRVGRMILAALDNVCLTEMLIIASALSVQDPRDRPLEHAQAADEAHKKFADEKSEFISYLKIWRWFEDAIEHKKSNRLLQEQCRANFLSQLRLREWRDVHSQLLTIVREQGWRLNEAPATYDNLHLALLTGLLGNIGYKPEEESWYLGARGIKFHLWPGSSLTKKPGRWVVAAELVDTTRLYARTIAAIQPEWLEKVGGHLLKKSWGEPRWEKRQGYVTASERATLYGLVVYSQRRINFGNFNPTEAREIFIREALVGGDFDTRAPFFAHNHKLVREIENLEHKSRRLDVLVDEELIAAFYDQAIPKDIVSAAAFEKWYKDAALREPKLLYLNRDDLMRHEAAGVTTDLFPKTMQVAGLQMQLTYHFEPGSLRDGVTLTVPLFALNQVSGARAEWLVPGMLKEKVHLLLKSLPQKLRRHCVPLPEYAAGFCDRIEEKHAFGRGDLLSAVIADVREQKGIATLSSDYKLETLPAHHFMNFKVIDEHGRQLEMGRNLAALQAQFSAQARESFQKLAEQGDVELAGLSAPASPKQMPGAVKPVAQQAALSSDSPSIAQYENLTAWTFGELPELLEIKQGKLTLIGFPALVDKGTSCSLEVFDDPAVAARTHRIGLRRLFALQLKDQIKFLEKNVPGMQQLGMQFLPLGSQEELRDQIIALALDIACLQDPLPADADAFAKRRDEGKTRLNLLVNEIARLLANILGEFHGMPKRLQTIKAHAAAQADIQAQLSQLIGKRFVAETPYTQLTHFPRYLKAINVRMEKLRGDPSRDAKLLADWNLVAAPYQRELKTGARRGDPQMAEFRWLLEELRVSLFAQELRTPMPVSAKRLQKVWESMQR